MQMTTANVADFFCIQFKMLTHHVKSYAGITKVEHMETHDMHSRYHNVFYLFQC